MKIINNNKIVGFGFEWGADPIQDDPRLFNLNVQERCDDFASQVRQRSLAFRTDNVMIPFGCDFQFENAIMEYKVCMNHPRTTPNLMIPDRMIY